MRATYRKPSNVRRWAVPVATKTFALIVLALLSGVCVVYLPAPAFAVAGVAFAAVLWSVIRGRHPRRAKRSMAGDAQKGRGSRIALTTRLVSVFLLLWWLASIAPIVAYSPRDSTGAAGSSIGGSLQYQVLLIAFGCVGAMFLPRAIKWFDPAFRWVAALWGLHIIWIFTSLFWSAYPPITFRNAVAFVLVSIGSFGLGAGFYGDLPNGRDLFLRHVFTAGALSALALLLPLPLRWQEYALLDPSQRLDIGGNFPAFVISPIICALFVLIGTSVLGLRDWRKRDWLWILFLVLPLLVLKSRSPILYAAVALAVFYLLCRADARSRVLQAALLFVVGSGAYVGYTEGVYDSLVPYLTRGNAESTANLTGRIPLWGIVLSYIQDHPWLGVGFAAFWNPENYPRMEQLVGFPVVSAHNGFLDMLLSTGAVGLAILLTFCFCALATVLGRVRRHDPLGWLAFLFVSFYILQNLTSSIFTEFYEITLIVVLAVLGLLASSPPAKRPRSPSEKPTVMGQRVPSPR